MKIIKLTDATEYCSPECICLEVEPTSVICTSVLPDGSTEPIEDKPWTW